MQKRFSSKLCIENQAIQGKRETGEAQNFGGAEEKAASGRIFGVADKGDDR